MASKEYKVISVNLHKYMYETFNRLEGADCKTEIESISREEAEALCSRHNALHNGRYFMYTCEFFGAERAFL